MGGLSIWHWIIVLVVVLLIFGTKRLRGAGRDLGEAVKGFKEGMKSGSEGTDEAPASPPPQVGAANKSAKNDTVDVEARTKS